MQKFITLLFIVVLFLSCKKDNPTNHNEEILVGKLELLQSYTLDIPEPSGLSFGPGGNSLLAVSDSKSRIYELDFEGNILRTLNFKGNDLEGICYNPDKNLIAVVEEILREVIMVDYDSGEKMETFKINVSYMDEESGLEGISYNINTKNYLIVNEKSPRLSILWNPDLGVINQDELDFSLDCSGVFIYLNRSNLWYISDESRSVYQCDTNNKVLASYSLDSRKYEGIIIKGDSLFVVNDDTSKLNIYKMTTN